MRFGRQRASAAATPPLLADGEINFGAIAQHLWRNKSRIIGPTLLIAAAAFIVVNLIAPRYKSEARVLVEGRENIFLRPEAEKTVTERAQVDQEAVTSQVQLVLSRDLARIVVDKLGLAELREFDGSGVGLSPGALLRLIGLGRDPSTMQIEERVLAAYYERLTAFPIEKSRVIAIEFQSVDPDIAARAANVIAETYLSLQQVAKQEQVRAAGQWLSGELDKLRGKVSEAEARVEEFRARSNLFVGTNNISLTSQQLSELNTQLSSARAQKAEAENKARLIREMLRAGTPIESSDILNSELIRRLSEQRVTLRAQLAEQSSTLLDQHPRIRELKAQIANLEQQIRGEAERVARAFEADARIAGGRLDTVTASLDQLKRHAASTSDQDVQLRALEREAKAQRELFESYLAKYREASARDSIAAAPADARIISRATVSNIPAFPKKLPIVALSGIATFVMCSVFIVAGGLLGGGYTPPAASPIAAAAPLRASGARTRVTDRTPPAAARAPVAAPARRTARAVSSTTSVDAIAAAIAEAGEAGRRIAVIGAAREVGTTMTAIGLARALSRGARVVMVDLALESPNLDVIAVDPAAPGIADLVQGRASFGDVISRDGGSAAHVVPAGRFDDPQAIAGSGMLLPALGALAQSYDHLVIDAGAPSGAALAAMAQAATFAVLVVGETAADTAALCDGLIDTGFKQVHAWIGPPPPLAPAAQSAAA